MSRLNHDSLIVQPICVSNYDDVIRPRRSAVQWFAAINIAFATLPRSRTMLAMLGSMVLVQLLQAFVGSD